jgi:hypothetical protein
MITPAAPLSYSTAYELYVTTAVKNAAGVAIATTYTSPNTFTTVAAAAAPTVSAAVPDVISGAVTGTAITVTPQITFSQAMNATTITASSVAVVTAAAPTTPIAATVSMQNGNTTVMITPATPLSYNTAYELYVTTAVKNAAGVALATTYTSPYTFTTVASGAPAISNLLVTGITSTTATITWHTNVAASGNAVAYGVTYALGASQATSTGNGVTSHSASLTGLTANSTYYFQISSTAGGQATTAGIYSFITEAANTGIAVSVQTLKSFATADNTYTNGWEFRFSITDNVTSDTSLQMKFNDWLSSSGSNIAALGNMKIALDDNVAGVQAGTDGVAVGNNYTNEPTPLTLVDQNPNVGGIQTVIYVYVAVPSGSGGGSYSTSYGIHTQ